MKTLPWICALSLAANLGLLAYTSVRPALPSRVAAEPAANNFSKSAPPSAAALNSPVAIADGEGEARPFVRADTPLAKILDGSDLRAMRDALEASGLTAADAKAVIRTRIRESQKTAREAIDRRRGPQDEIWWFQDDEARQKFEDQRRTDRRALDEHVTQALAGLFGPEPKPATPEKIHNQAQFLPEDKRLAVSRILQDYDAMQREARPRNYRGMELPSDQEKRRFIEEERRRDLEAVLTPEELRAFDLRYSQTAQNIRWQLADMKPSLQEYEAIFSQQNELDRNFNTHDSGEKPQDFWENRQKAEQAGLARLREQLGEDRFVDYALSRDHSARQILVAADRYGLPPDASRQLWKLREQTSRQSKAIYDDPALDRDEKLARLAELSRRSRHSVDQVLTPEAYAELKQNNLVNWLEGMEKGHVRVYDALGNSYSGFGL